MPQKDKTDDKTVVATHRKARHYYEILEVFEAGLQLRGPEVKSLRSGRASLDGCFGRAADGALWLEDFYIPPYSFATNIEPLDARRRRNLLLHAADIAKIEGKLTTKG